MLCRSTTYSRCGRVGACTCPSKPSVIRHPHYHHAVRTFCADFPVKMTVMSLENQARLLGLQEYTFFFSFNFHKNHAKPFEERLGERLAEELLLQRGTPCVPRTNHRTLHDWPSCSSLHEWLSSRVLKAQMWHF